MTDTLSLSDIDGKTYHQLICSTSYKELWMQTTIDESMSTKFYVKCDLFGSTNPIFLAHAIEIYNNIQGEP